METHKSSSCNGAKQEPQRHTQPNTLLEPNHPRPGTFTMAKHYVPQSEPVFPPGYRPSQSCINPDVPSTFYGEFPMSTKCSQCRDTVITDVTYRPGRVACLLSATLLIIGCCLAPFCVRRFQDVVHWCPNCENHLGTFKRDLKQLQL